MKSTRKYLLALCVAALGFAAPSLRADDAPPVKKEHGPKGDRVAELKEKLSLTDAQVAQLKPILDDERAQVKALKDKDLPREEQGAEIHKIREASRTKIEAILTPEQKTKFEAGRKGPPKGEHGDK